MMAESQVWADEPVYGARIPIAKISYGMKAPFVERIPGDSGEGVPNRIESAGPDRVWIGNLGLMPIGIIDLRLGQVVKYINLGGKLLPSGQQLARQLYSNFSRDRAGNFYVMMATVATALKPSQQVVIKLDASGEIKQEYAMSGLAPFQHYLFTVDASSRFWIGEAGTQVFAADGKSLFSVSADGVLLRSGFFLSHGDPPLKLFDRHGSLLGTASGRALPKPAFFLANTAKDIVVREYVGPQTGIVAHLSIREIYRLDTTTRTLDLFDFLVYPSPAPTLHKGAPSRSVADAPGPSGLLSLTFEENDDILTIEDADRFHIYRHQRMSGPDAWRKKLDALPQRTLTLEEIEWHRAEFLARTGQLEPHHLLYSLFSRCHWFKTKKLAPLSKAYDLTWQHLAQLRPK